MSHGWVPTVRCSFLGTKFGECILEIDICLKSGTFMDTATLVSDLRAPFAVLAAKTRLLVCQTLPTVSNNVPFSLLYNVIIVVFLLLSVQLCPWKGARLGKYLFRPYVRVYHKLIADTAYLRHKENEEIPLRLAPNKTINEFVNQYLAKPLH